MRTHAVALLLFTASCAPGNAIVVQLVSNLSPVTDVDHAHVEIARDGASVSTLDVALPPTSSLGRPRRLVDLEGIAAARYVITVRLDHAGTPVLTRHVVRDLSGAEVVTVLMTRECANVTCPASDPAAVECLAGRCVAPSCDEEHPELCAPECHVDADCTLASAACAPARCSASGACVAIPDDTRCATGELCDPARGCVPSGRVCTLGAWGAASALTSLDSPQVDYGVEISDDGLGIVFQSDRAGDHDLYTASRATRADAFDAPVRIDALSMVGANDSDPSITDDELVIVFTSSRGGGTHCLYESQRADRGAAWGAPVRLDALCAVEVGGAWISNDGLRLYYNTQIDMNGEGTIFGTSRASRSDPFPVGTPVAGLPSGHSGYVALSIDESVAYFEVASLTGELRGYMATRSGPGAPFENAVIVPGFESMAIGDLSITADDLVLAYAAGSAMDDLFTSSRACD